MSRELIRLRKLGEQVTVGMLLCDATPDKFNSFISKMRISVTKLETYENPYTIVVNGDGVYNGTQYSIGYSCVVGRQSFVHFSEQSAGEYITQLIDHFLAVTESKEVDDPDLLKYLRQSFMRRLGEKEYRLAM